jgi:adenine-specific DNA methylase
MAPPRLKSALRHINQSAISKRARVETRNREIHLPPISVYRWWARRTEAVSGALIDAVITELKANKDVLLADPFAGGGVIPLAALARGHSIYAQDLSPWVSKGLATMLSLPASSEIRQGHDKLAKSVAKLLHRAYATTFSDGCPATISQTMRVAVSPCTKCEHEHRLFPHALVTRIKRKELGGAKAFLACRKGHLFLGRSDRRSNCPVCDETVHPKETYLERRFVTCPSCGSTETLERRSRKKKWIWEVVLVERVQGRRREIAKPSRAEAKQASDRCWRASRELGAIPQSQETRVLRRHGFKTWNDLYPKRQRAVTEALLGEIKTGFKNGALRSALEMAVLGTVEMAGLLSRWDRFYLKAFESMASHRFNFSTFVAEPNVFGAGLAGRGTLARRLKLFERASEWLEAHEIGNQQPTIARSSERRFHKVPATRCIIVSGSSERLLLPDESVTAIVTDPPYHDDVQYHELSLPLRAWAQLPLRRTRGEAVVIPHSNELKAHIKYRGALTGIFKEFRRVLKPDGRLLFSYANRESAAWVNLFAALRAADFRPVGYTILHSENETDHIKRKGRAFSLDLILELAPRGDALIEHWKPKRRPRTAEEKYLASVGDAFLESGTLLNGWELELVSKLKGDIFISPNRVHDSSREAGSGLRASIAKKGEALIRSSERLTNWSHHLHRTTI